MENITYVTLKQPTLMDKIISTVQYYFYIVYNTVTKYGPKHPEYGTYSTRDINHMTYCNKKWMK